MNRQTRMLPAELEKQVRKTLEEWAVAGKVRRLWARDATLWTGADEASWLGWLEIAGVQVRRMDDLRRLAEDVRSLGFTRAPVLGMGGPSLACRARARARRPDGRVGSADGKSPATAPSRMPS